MINHHPHVFGGLDWDGRSLAAWALGNFVFDQTVWPTFASYLLRVELRDGEVSRALAIPLRVHEFVPKGITGRAASSVAAETAALSRGPVAVQGDVLELRTSGRATARSRTAPLEPRTIYRLEPGIRTRAVRGTVDYGRDLLWVGGFEDDDVDPRRQTPLWGLSGRDEQVAAAFAYHGAAGLRLTRDSSNCSDAYVSPIHRLLVRPGSRLTVVGAIRSTGAPAVQLSWYADTKGPSRVQHHYPVRGTGGRWKRFRIDVHAPPWAVALTPYLRLSPPTDGESTADWDELAVLAWSSAPRGGSFTEYLRARAAAAISLRRPSFKSARPAPPPPPTPLRARRLEAASPPPRAVNCRQSRQLWSAPAYRAGG